MFLSGKEVAQLGRDAGFEGEALVMWLAITKAESGWNPSAVNVAGNSPPSRDRGLSQINDYWHPEVDDACAFEPACNARETLRISNGGQDWSPWSTWHNGAYKQFLGEARAILTEGEGPVRPHGWQEIDRYLRDAGVRIGAPTLVQTTGGTHATNSNHYKGLARDYGEFDSDTLAVVNALAPFAVTEGPLIELYYADTGTWFPHNVGSHTDHVHAAIREGAYLPMEEDDMPFSPEDINNIVEKAVDKQLWEHGLGKDGPDPDNLPDWMNVIADLVAAKVKGG